MRVLACISLVIAFLAAKPANAIAQGIPIDPSVTGKWEGPYTWPVQSTHAAVLPGGEVLDWSYNTMGGSGSNCWLFDPRTFNFTNYSISVEVFCGGHTFLSDGRLFVNGNINTEKLTHTFDPVNGWVRQDDMTDGRFYPTSVTLANGNILTLSASTNHLEVYSIPTATWHRVKGADQNLDFYPRLFLVPGGNVFSAGPLDDSQEYDTTTKTWSHVAFTSTVRHEGTAVQLPPNPGRYLITGGYDASSTSLKSAEIMDLSQSTPAWRPTADMNRSRHHLNSTILPNGQILVTGGAKYAASKEVARYEAEIFDPANETWTILASMHDPRMYHSTAVLLDDGRVLVAGGEGYSTAEIFSPPYLFQGPRPTLTGVPASVPYGQWFKVHTDDAWKVGKVVLMAPGAATHSFNMTQRYLTLEYKLTTAAHGRVDVEVRAPASSDLAPSFYYMLFLVDRDGVPSAGRFVQLK